MTLETLARRIKAHNKKKNGLSRDIVSDQYENLSG